MEIPNPEKTLPALKKVMNKLISVIEKAKEIGRKITGHAEQTSVSLRAKLAEAQRKQGGRTKKKNGAKEERYNPIKPNGYYDFSDNTFCLR